MPQQQHLCAVVNWSDTAAIQVIDLVDGTETVTSYNFQEAIDKVTTDNDYNGGMIITCDTSEFFRANLDGKMEPFDLNALPFMADMDNHNIKVFADIDRAIIKGYDRVASQTKYYLVDLVANTASEISDGDSHLDINSAPVNYGNVFNGTLWQGRVAFIVHSGDFVGKLWTYDILADEVTEYALPDVTDPLLGGGWWDYNDWRPFFHNNKLLMVWNRTTNHLATSASVYEVDVDWTITPHVIPMMHDQAARVAANPAFDQNEMYPISAGTLCQERRYLPYRHNMDGLAWHLAVLDLETFTFTFVTTEIPATLPFDYAGVGVNYSDYSSNSRDEIFVSMMNSIKDNNGITHRIAKFYIWNLLTGALLREIPFALEGNVPDLNDYFLVKLPIYKVDGHVLRNGNPSVSKVELLDINGRRLVGKTLCDADGFFSFRCYSNQPKTVLAHHPVNNSVKPSATLIPEPVME